MRYAITQRNTPQTHLKPRYTKELPVRACAEHAHAYACAGRPTLARFARSGAPGSLRCPSEAPPQESNQPTQSRGSLARFARSGAPDSLRCLSKCAPIPSLAPLARASCLLRAVGTPALRRQGKGKDCAIAY